jgi:ABC-type antimicrobial peptide transport system ATPase subunit
MPIVCTVLDIDDIIAITANEALEIIKKWLTTMQILYCKKVVESMLTLKIPAKYQDFKGLFELESD